MGASAFGHTWPTERCLIPVEAFAFPEGPVGRRTRHWFGLEEQPIFAWAGLYRRLPGSDPGFVGAVTAPNPLIGRYARHMPIILAREEQEPWLTAPLGQLLAYRRRWPAEAMYGEPSDEPWRPSTGRQA